VNPFEALLLIAGLTIAGAATVRTNNRLERARRDWEATHVRLIQADRELAGADPSHTRVGV
jgi:hypothetical protein